MKVNKILCPVDFSDTSEVGVKAATSIATEYGSELVLMHVLNFPFAQIEALPPGFDVEAYYSEMADEADLQLAEMVDADAADFMAVTTRVERGVPHREIVRVADEDDFDLVVMPTHGRHGLARALLGSTTERVVRMVECPVLSVHTGDASAFKPETILCATDFSESADEALAAACAMAEQYCAKLVLLHVVTLWEYDPGNPSWRFPALPDEYAENVVAGPEAQLEDLRKACDFEVETMLIRGYDAASDVVRVAGDIDADLVVMGTHGHTGFTHALLGSVASKVVRDFEGPVLTVRHKSE
jgi:nucleotide-binding universal stress UspA family protein